MIGLGPIMSTALAADADLPVKAVAPVELPWWTHGFVDFGGRGFLNNPTYGGHIFQGQGSLAKYYEYSTVKPGPFGDFNVATGSWDGLYEINAWGQNVGYSDQRYNADFSKAGEHYFNFMWDETPHVYSTSASTLFNTNGNALTLINPNIGALISAAPGGAGFPAIPNAGNPRQNQRDQHHHQPECCPDQYRDPARYGICGLSLHADRQLGHQGQLLQHAQDRKPGRRRAFHVHEYRFSC